MLSGLHVQPGLSIDLVCLVDLVHVVSFIRPNSRTSQIDQMNKTGEQDLEMALIDWHTHLVGYSH